MMKSVLLALLLVTSLIQAKEFYQPKANEDFPSEIAIILQSLATDRLTPAQLNILDGFLTNLSSYAKQLPKTDLFFVVKSEAAKAILAARPQSSPQYQNYTLNKLKQIEADADWKNLNSWSTYVFRSLLKDANNLVSDARYLSLWRPIENPSAQSEQAVLRKRVELVLTWVDFLAYTTTSMINERLESLAFNVMERIERGAWLLATLNAKPLSTPAPLAFELVKIDTEKEASLSDTLNKVIDPVLEEKTVKLPEPVNDWLPQEIPNGPQSGKNIIQKKDPFYSPPSELPKPTNDWILSL